MFGFIKDRFVLSMSFVVASNSRIDLRLLNALVSAIDGKAFEMRRTSVNGVLYLLITSKIRLAVVDMDVDPAMLFNDDVERDVTKFVGIFGR